MKTVPCFLLVFLLLSIPFHVFAQYKIVKGTILNDTNGALITDANIFDTVSGIGTISNKKGFFSLMLMENKPEITISHEGFKSATSQFILKNDTTVVVRLIPLLQPKIKAKEQPEKKEAEQTKQM